MQFVNLKNQYLINKKNIDNAISKVLLHGQFILGPEVIKLEKVLAKYVGTKYCITVSSGTDALLISLMSLGVGPGDEVITPSFSFISIAYIPPFLGLL